MSVYGGLVPLGFPHSNNLRLFISFRLFYHNELTYAIGFFVLVSFSIESCKQLCYNKCYQSGKQVQVLCEAVAVRRATLLS